MPLVGPTSYSSTLESFLIHWAKVDERLGVGHALVLPDGLTRAGGEALQVELDARMDEAAEAAIDVAIARAALALGRVALRARLGQFCDLVRAYWHGTPWVPLVPTLPQLTAAPEKFLQVCREALRLWTLLEVEPAPPGAPMPITLDPGGEYGRADFAAELAAVQGRVLALEAAHWARSVALARRDATLATVRAALMAYNRAVPGRLPAGDMLIAVMPALWPPPGHTPEPVALAAEWDAEAQAARLTWEKSEDAMLDHYEVRGCAGPEYVGEEEVAVARVAADAPREVLSAELLPRPGVTAAFRVYVVLTTGNERASATQTVLRPENPLTTTLDSPPGLVS